MYPCTLTLRVHHVRRRQTAHHVTHALLRREERVVPCGLALLLLGGLLQRHCALLLQLAQPLLVLGQRCVLVVALRHSVLKGKGTRVGAGLGEGAEVRRVSRCGAKCHEALAQRPSTNPS